MTPPRRSRAATRAPGPPEPPTHPGPRAKALCRTCWWSRGVCRCPGWALHAGNARARPAPRLLQSWARIGTQPPGPAPPRAADTPCTSGCNGMLVPSTACGGGDAAAGRRPSLCHPTSVGRASRGWQGTRDQQATSKQPASRSTPSTRAPNPPACADVCIRYRAAPAGGLPARRQHSGRQRWNFLARPTAAGPRTLVPAAYRMGASLLLLLPSQAALPHPCMRSAHPAAASCQAQPAGFSGQVVSSKRLAWEVDLHCSGDRHRIQQAGPRWRVCSCWARPTACQQRCGGTVACGRAAGAERGATFELLKSAERLAPNHSSFKCRSSPLALQQHDAQQQISSSGSGGVRAVAAAGGVGGERCGGRSGRGSARPAGPICGGLTQLPTLSRPPEDGTCSSAPALVGPSNYSAVFSSSAAFSSVLRGERVAGRSRILLPRAIDARSAQPAARRDPAAVRAARCIAAPAATA